MLIIINGNGAHVPTLIRFSLPFTRIANSKTGRIQFDRCTTRTVTVYNTRTRKLQTKAGGVRSGVVRDARRMYICPMNATRAPERVQSTVTPSAIFSNADCTFLATFARTYTSINVAFFSKRNDTLFHDSLSSQRRTTNKYIYTYISFHSSFEIRIRRRNFARPRSSYKRVHSTRWQSVLTM